MNVQINEDQFSDESINRFLCGEMNAEQAALIESRMESCEDFAQRVTRLAAHSWDWGVVTCSLVDDEFDDRRDTHRSRHDFSSTATIAAAPTCASEQAGSLLQRELSGWLDPTDDPDMLGRFAGYEIVGVIGHGGMGIVMKGFERALNRFVAIKVLAPRLAGNGAARKRFEREARAAAAVLHDNVIAIHRVDQWHGLPFLVMPYVAGESLQQRIDREGPLDLEGTLRIAQQIAAGLAAAHAQGLVHRDIKPANILLDQGVERVAITDFGLARAADDAPITRTGFVTGTPMYMSPEQASAQAIDHRSDLFSLGSVMYSMATGVPPFQADENQSLLGKIRNEPAPDIREKQETVPEWLAELIDWCHAKSPTDRPHTAQEIEHYLGEWLARLKQPQHIPAPPRPAIPQSAKRDRRPPNRWHRKVFTAVGGFLFVLAGIFITLETSKGTITIQSEVNDVPIVIKKGDKVYKTLTASRGSNSIKLYSGEYQIAIEGEPDQVTLKNGSVTLGWRDEAVVQIRENKLPAASDVAGSLPSTRLLSPKEAIERILQVVPPSSRASAQGHRDPSKEESIQILVGDEDADKQQYRPGDRIDVYVLASGQNEPATNENPVMQDVAVVSWGPLDMKRNDGQTSWSGQSIVVNGPTDSVLLAPESELLQDLHRQEKIRFYVRLHDGVETKSKTDEKAASMWQTTPWMDVMNHVSNHGMRRVRMTYGDVEFKLVTSKGDSRRQRHYHVWFNGRNRRADCREDASDAAENYTRILTPRMNWYYDQQDNSKTKFQKRFPENTVGWDGIIDVRKIGLVNRSFEEMNATGFFEDLQPLDAGPPRVEQSQLDDGQPITIVKMPLWHRWTEYWLSPNHGNAPIYMAKGWSEKDNPAAKHQSTMHTQWKRIDGVWFPTSIKYHHQCEHLNIDESTQFELISASFSKPPSLEIFDPKNVDTTPLVQLTTWNDVKQQVESMVIERERMVHGDVEFNSVTQKGDTRRERHYHVWFNGQNRRADCRDVSNDEGEHSSQIITPTAIWSIDHQDSSKLQSRRLAPDVSHWDGVIDVRMIGFVNRWVEALDSSNFYDDLLPKGYSNPRVELREQDDGHTVSVVKLDRKADRVVDSWVEFWLSPEHGNRPIYMASGWTEKNNPDEKYVLKQQSEWKRIDGVWFPTSITHRYQCEHLNIDESAQFELISASFSEPPAREIFDASRVAAEKVSSNKGPQAEDAKENRGQAETSGTDHQRDTAKVVDSPCQLKVQVIFVADAAHHLLDEVDGLPAEEMRERVELARFVQEAFADPQTIINGTRQVTKNLSSVAVSEMLSRLVDRRLVEIGTPVLVETEKTTSAPIALESMRPKNTSWRKMLLRIRCKDMKDGRLGFLLTGSKAPLPGEESFAVPVDIVSVIRFQLDETAIAPWYFHWLNSDNREQFRKRVGGEQFLLFQSKEPQRVDATKQNPLATSFGGESVHAIVGNWKLEEVSGNTNGRLSNYQQLTFLDSQEALFRLRDKYGQSDVTTLYYRMTGNRLEFYEQPEPDAEWLGSCKWEIEGNQLTLRFTIGDDDNEALRMVYQRHPKKTAPSLGYRERQRGKKTNVHQIMVPEGDENKPLFLVQWDADEGISGLSDETPLGRQQLGSPRYRFILDSTGAKIVPLVDREDRKIEMRVSMECQDADDAFWKAIRGKKIGFRVDRESFQYVANGGTIRMKIYLPVQNGVFGDELKTLGWKRLDTDTLELPQEKIGPPVVSVLMQPATEDSPPSGSVGRNPLEFNEQKNDRRDVDTNSEITIPAR